MGGGNKPQNTTNTQGTTESKTNPWEPTQPLLQELISKYGGISTDLTDAQKSASDGLVSASNNIPGFGDQSANAVGKLFNFSTQPQIGMLSDSYKSLNDRLGATANGDNLDPYKTPGFSDALNTMTNDITNKVKGVYSASGRDPSGAGSFAGSLGRGLTQGLSGALQTQYNTNVGNMNDAAKTLYNAGGSTASGQANLAGLENSTGANAVSVQDQVGKAYLTPEQQKLAAAQAQYALPWSNLASLQQPLTQIAGLGGQSSGQSTQQQQTYQPQSTMSNVIGGATAAASLLPMLFSDERVKEDIAPIGMLNDGQKIHRFRYKGDPAFRIGLLAQEVERHVPDAVGEIGGIKAVEHKRATDRAARIGRMAA